MESSKILLVDDHPLMREGLCQWISAEPGLEVAGMVGSAQEAIAFVESSLADLVITDLSLPGRSGLELIKDLGATHPELPVLALSMHDELLYAERVLRAGGRGYVMKNSSPEVIISAIRTVLRGEVFASQAVTGHFLEVLSSGKGKSNGAYPLDILTDREIEVFELIGRAKSNQGIAAQLGISVRTLDAHRAHIREKLGLADSKELTCQAIRWVEAGLVQ